jgi:predicted Zn-dependent protease
MGMSEKQRTFEAELRMVKSPKLVPEVKTEEGAGKQADVRRKRRPRTFSRETVVRLINWFKQD